MEPNVYIWLARGKFEAQIIEKLANNLVMATFDTTNMRMTSLNSCLNTNLVISNVGSHSFQDVVSM